MRDDWAREYFERGYAQRWTLGPPSAQAQHDADALWRLLGLTAGARVLDVGCGHGRSAVTMAQRGAQVVGLDFAAHLLARASQLARASAVGVSWVRGDMRRLPVCRGSMRAAILFDALGFFEEEEENLTVLRELERVLDRSRRVVVKVANGEPMLRGFRPTEREQRGDTLVEIERTLLTNPRRLVEDLAMSGPHGTRRFQRRQRLYDVGEMASAMAAAGLRIVTVLAAVTGAAFEPTTSATMVIVSERRSE